MTILHHHYPDPETGASGGDIYEKMKGPKA